MTIRIKPVKSANRVLIGMEKSVHRHQQGIENGLHVIGEIVGDRTGLLIKQGNKTGRQYPNLPNRSSAPGQAPAEQSGELRKSYNKRVHGPFSMEVGESAPYAVFLENGTRKMKPRPHLIRAIEETQGDAVKVFYDETDKVINK